MDSVSPNIAADGEPAVRPRADSSTFLALRYSATVEASDVLDLLSALDNQDVHYWLYGGWGVDCLLGEQSRAHSDLDLALPRIELDRVRALSASRGYFLIRDWLPMTLAFRDDQGHEVDLHPVDMTADGGGTQVLLDGRTWHYAQPVEGSIEGRTGA